MSIRTRVAMTTEEVTPGVPYWGPNTVTTDLLPGQTDIAIENLVAGAPYYVKSWNEDQFGNKSAEVVVRVDAERPTRLVPLTFSANGVLDQTSPVYAFVKVPDSVIDISSARVTFAFREFVVPIEAAAAGGSSTPTSGASSAGTTGTSLPNLGFVVQNPSHTHTDPQGGSTGASGVPPGGTTVVTGVIGDGSHSHGIPHTHDVSIPTHEHALTYGTFEEPYPVSHSCVLRVYERVAGAWVERYNQSGITADLWDKSLAGIITGPGDWRISIQSSGGTPQGGRLGCDVFGTIEVVL